MKPPKPSKFTRMMSWYEHEQPAEVAPRGTKAYDELLHRVRREVGKSDPTPSETLWAEYDFECKYYREQGGHSADSGMAYNISDVAMQYITHAYKLLTDIPYRKRELNGSKKSPAWCALQNCAKAIGYRMMRGYIAINCKLHGTELERFNDERATFLQTFCTLADAAHARHGCSDASDRALSVVRMCFDEVATIAGWLRKIGPVYQAEAIEKELRAVGYYD